MATIHEPVLCETAIQLLNCPLGRVFVDGTIGGGGHSHYLLQSCPDIQLLVGIDRDQGALARAREKMASFGDKCVFVKGSFAEIRNILNDVGVGSVDGVLLDLGISAYQLRTPERGFSFSFDGPLDMRMDREEQTTAYDLVNTLPQKSLERVLRDYGEEKWAAQIAKRIVRTRSEAPIMTTRELADLIFFTIPRHAHPRSIHPATRTFQAFRIAVNDELSHLQRGLEECIDVLAPGGRVVVISFHSLEDRIVKHAFRHFSRVCTCPPRTPRCQCGHQPILKVLTKKAVVPTDEEITRNPLSRSARLRAAEKLPV